MKPNPTLIAAATTLALTLSCGGSSSPKAGDTPGAGNFAATAIDRAKVELSCADVAVDRFADYSGGGVYVLSGCSKEIKYDCMGTVCQKACSYAPTASDYSGAGETDGNFHALVKQRASVEFACDASKVLQASHSDSTGGGLYMMSVCGNAVKYNCMGTVCNLACD